jgi:1,4-dihydroxy-2-naphthoate octaprenyltransferase
MVILPNPGDGRLKVNSDLVEIKNWVLASRPRTLPAATVPVLVGTAAAFAAGKLAIGPALAALAGALLIQIGANFANDVFDFKKGADTAERLGPTRATQAGLITPRQMYFGMAVVFGLAIAIGFYLLWIGGWPIVAIGVASILSALAYTGGPWPLGYHGLGDLFVFIFFGLVAVCGTFYVQALTVPPVAWLAALPVGFLAVAILVVNNLRDIATDTKAGKRTLAVRMGRKGAEAQYALLLAAAYLTPIAMILLKQSKLTVLLPLLTIPMAVKLFGRVKTQDGRALNPVLGATAQLELFYGILFAIGLAIQSSISV